ncbi:RagB/SusD family nutrient uptake outer membrane protein [Sphingobacterium alkalisoli]|uniref:RagB/SusD family nutrient uptake outer membrane protein n=1 Tax=Sphingobacterium alkalisoli TaxID=1874115 RepID=A0A4U0GYJ0_9SPHI|nr:RagB/SusD family nutrient uptake outer membrane protein [Sphingobacterium alkalisoli]TJY64275.1 RagB/SusD family nutrient uptake outer membrane protein [Sphingobacterium alkalisoli]GGH22762.1 hypothetical protein GCM10011418_29540 [Sphingobacterium alkalisoli]
MKNIIYIGLALAIFYTITSCEKYLEVEPDMRAQINTVEKVAKLLGSAYPGYGNLAMAETYSDNVNDKGPTSGAPLLDPYVDLYYWNDVEGSGANTPTQYWNGCYAAIAAANQALKSIEEYNFGSEANPYKGEALVARAYSHFMLVTFFAKAYVIDGDNSSPGIPYVLEPETITLKQYSRGTVEGVYEQIQRDLEEGIPLLKGGKWEVPKYHFTYAAANAFATRFYLFRGNWDKVIEHANEVFPGGDYTSQIRPENTTIRGLTSAERQIEFTKADKNYNLLLGQIRSVYQRQGTGYYSRYGIGLIKYNELFGRSTAAGAAFAWNGSSYASSTHYWPRKYNEYFFYTNVAAGTGEAYIMIPLITSDEALVNRAEAYIRKNNFPNALADLNFFASTRILNYNINSHRVTAAKSKVYFDVEDDADALIKTVLQFKQIAFLSEGIRWLDILRHRIPVAHPHIDNLENETFQTLGPDDSRRVFQIPSEALLAGIERNPR